MSIPGERTDEYSKNNPMKLTLSPQEVHFIVKEFFKAKHSLHVGAITWNEDGSAELLTSKSEQSEVIEPLYNGLTKAQIDKIISGHIQNGNYITGIKELRTYVGIGLKEAKDYVDYYRDHKVPHPKFPI